MENDPDEQERLAAIAVERAKEENKEETIDKSKILEADERIRGSREFQARRMKEAKELYRAMSLFQLYLGDGQRIDHQRIKAMMKAENVSTSTMNRAKTLAGVKSDTKGGGSVWYMTR